MRTATRLAGGVVHPLHAILLAFPIALFCGALAADVAFLRTSEPQWTNFAAWLNAGALFFGGGVLGWALIGAFVVRGTRAFVYLGVVALMWIIGLANAFKHTQDGWSSVGPAGVTMSTLCALLALVAGWLLYSGSPAREAAE